jgi:hypothetical protein
MPTKAHLRALPDANVRQLDTEELAAVSGGFIWIPVVVGSFLLGTAIRTGIDAAVQKITAPAK